MLATKIRGLNINCPAVFHCLKSEAMFFYELNFNYTINNNKQRMWRQLQLVVYFDTLCNTLSSLINTVLSIEAGSDWYKMQYFFINCYRYMSFNFLEINFSKQHINPEFCGALQLAYKIYLEEYKQKMFARLLYG